MTTEITFRAAVPGDIDVLLRLLRGLQQDDPWSVPFREEAVRESGEVGNVLGPKRRMEVTPAESCVGGDTLTAATTLGGSVLAAKWSRDGIGIGCFGVHFDPRFRGGHRRHPGVL
jgi:hypothetical protein